MRGTTEECCQTARLGGKHTQGRQSKLDGRRSRLDWTCRRQSGWRVAFVAFMLHSWQGSSCQTITASGAAFKHRGKRVPAEKVSPSCTITDGHWSFAESRELGTIRIVVPQFRHFITSRSTAKGAKPFVSALPAAFHPRQSRHRAWQSVYFWMTTGSIGVARVRHARQCRLAVSTPARLPFRSFYTSWQLFFLPDNHGIGDSMKYSPPRVLPWVARDVSILGMVDLCQANVGGEPQAMRVKQSHTFPAVFALHVHPRL